MTDDRKRRLLDVLLMVQFDIEAANNDLEEELEEVYRHKDIAETVMYMRGALSDAEHAAHNLEWAIRELKETL